jgi:hypothetical protein
MSRDVKIGETVVDQFPVFDTDGYTKKSGETVFTKSLWVNGAPSGQTVTISEIGSSGEYEVGFTPNAEGYWALQILIDYNKDVWGEGYQASAGTIGDVYGMVQRILGLSHENTFIDNTTYDSDYQMVSGRVRLFDSKTNCDAATDGGSETTGLLATYTITTTWEALNEFAVFKQTKD